MVNNNWFSKHVDTVVVLGGILASICWMNGKFDSVNGKFDEVNKTQAEMKTDITMIKTVLILKGIMPEALAVNKMEEGK